MASSGVSATDRALLVRSGGGGGGGGGGEGTSPTANGRLRLRRARHNPTGLARAVEPADSHPDDGDGGSNDEDDVDPADLKELEERYTARGNGPSSSSATAAAVVVVGYEPPVVPSVSVSGSGGNDEDGSLAARGHEESGARALMPVTDEHGQSAYVAVDVGGGGGPSDTNKDASNLILLEMLREMRQERRNDVLMRMFKPETSSCIKTTYRVMFQALVVVVLVMALIAGVTLVKNRDTIEQILENTHMMSQMFEQRRTRIETVLEEAVRTGESLFGDSTKKKSFEEVVETIEKVATRENFESFRSTASSGVHAVRRVVDSISDVLRAIKDSKEVQFSVSVPPVNETKWYRDTLQPMPPPPPSPPPATPYIPSPPVSLPRRAAVDVADLPPPPVPLPSPKETEESSSAPAAPASSITVIRKSRLPGPNGRR